MQGWRDLKNKYIAHSTVPTRETLDIYISTYDSYIRLILLIPILHSSCFNFIPDVLVTVQKSHLVQAMSWNGALCVTGIQ